MSNYSEALMSHRVPSVAELKGYFRKYSKRLGVSSKKVSSTASCFHKLIDFAVHSIGYPDSETRKRKFKDFAETLGMSPEALKAIWDMEEPVRENPLPLVPIAISLTAGLIPDIIKMFRQNRKKSSSKNKGGEVSG